MSPSDRLSGLVEAVLAGAVSNRELREALPEAWAAAAVPCLQQPQVVLYSLFKRAVFVSDQDGVTEPPPEGLRVWRGAHPARAKGLAWFTSREQAAWFADADNAREQLSRARSEGLIEVEEAVAESQPPKLYRAHAPPEAILGLLGEQGERVVIVDPGRLRRFTSV